MNLRLIARLDVKAPKLIKPIHLEGVRVVGEPHVFARRYSEAGIDEILYMDAVASLYGRNSLTDLVRQTAEDVFIPMTVGGGLRSVEDVRAMLQAGADKVAINTAAVARPGLISEVAEQFGSQCMVLSVEAKRRPGRTDSWEVYTDGGREHSGLDVIDWVKQATALGVGEILLTSIDQEGTKQGFDVALTRAVADAVSVPVIASGGMGRTDHLVDVVNQGHADAVAMAHVLHYDTLSLDDIRAAAQTTGLFVRTP
jgi:cyclase